MLGVMLPTWWIGASASPVARAVVASASAPAVSSNWSGYMAHAAQSPHLSFGGVSATSTMSPTTGAFSVLWSSPTTQQRATAEAPPWFN
jgi:hypothetical protein